MLLSKNIVELSKQVTEIKIMIMDSKKRYFKATAHLDATKHWQKIRDLKTMFGETERYVTEADKILAYYDNVQGEVTDDDFNSIEMLLNKYFKTKSVTEQEALVMALNR